MNDTRIPVLLVTGFLGSGKTTFLNWLIHTHTDLQISLILNEFGDIKLESQFIKQDGGGDVVELNNGCMCCVAKSDIPRVVNYILDHSPHTRYILVEASGLSDPDPIYEAFSRPPLASKVRLESIICIVDAVNFEKIRVEHPIVLSQVGDAGVVIISKVEEAGQEKVKQVRDFISGLGNTLKIFEFTDELNPKLFLDQSVQPEVPSMNESDSINHHHDHDQMHEFWFTTDKLLNLDRLKDAFQAIPAQVYRAKGFVNTSLGKQLVQYVGSTLNFEPASWKEGENRSSAILFLGTDYDETQLVSLLQCCEELT